ncbi:CheY-like chemotaxis protein [Saonia flava]|uniref:CheY-like chemotaxis protein n=1 Tax=Saonia flava TaxID=523696 RepID=A0A846QM38_9FLAO|nr:response regulator [Saonia flava]NJB70036.1 CheY-like chemotaxis protein [Saonia flava]
MDGYDCSIANGIENDLQRRSIVLIPLRIAMNSKLKSILLIDDDKATNFVHKIVIKKADCIENVVVAENGQEALEYLHTTQNVSPPEPNIIFLDINMPVMNGWEFLEEYEKLNTNEQGDIILIMLTTSLNPDDLKKANGFSSISGYRNKPLTVEMIDEICEEFFAKTI